MIMNDGLQLTIKCKPENNHINYTRLAITLLFLTVPVEDVGELWDL